MTSVDAVEKAALRRTLAGTAKSRWSWRSKALIFLLGLSLLTGLCVYLLGPFNWNAGQVVLAVHLGLGLCTIGILPVWLVEHLPKTIPMARNDLFRNLSWIFLGIYVAVLATGLFNATPLFLYLVEVIWFPSFETFDIVATSHLILALVLAVMIVLHFLLPYRRQPAARRTGGAKTE